MSTCSQTLPEKRSASYVAFEQLYLGVRQQEQRIYTDEQLRRLPDITPSHRHAGEWEIRKRSAARLLNYLRGKRRPLHILEIGCGNGWLSAMLAGIAGANVTGMDINQVELQQAARVFKQDNLQFVADDFAPGRFPGIQFDVVVFAASLQYFSPLGDMLQQVQQCLTADGEIHIVDTMFYTPEQAADAQKRTVEHFTSQGYPAMAAYYFHHRLQDLEGFNYRILFHPAQLINKLFRKHPFYWICINR
ncbi:methyltransferase domain-containing protein [Chitinophaga agrisoli]|uniref:Methyltransferase domain-containing protein n=1 Tax=Chitinophaga agrisoli TaxID=2607653 RepID=A0A5B2VHH3_9BACT|nr:class I SAM-dependent methyltransferase [Chitinophaga agrisoli]KAA2239023.1 methyltransferase domain-containing protein [Chitinophaga agrisoli]